MKRTLEDLLVLITWKETDEDRANANLALDEFFSRMELYCKKLVYSQSKGNNEMFRDLYHLLMFDIWEKAHLYDDEKNSHDSEEIRVKKWLTSRMQGVVRDYWRELSKDKSILAFDENISETFIEAQTDEELIGEGDIHLKKLAISMLEEKVLSRRELDILQTHYEFKGYVPEEIRIGLCKEYEISESYRRLLKFRALEKVAKFIKSKSLTVVK